MSPPASPATRLHDTIVTNEQSGMQWRAGAATIDHGLIVVETRPPKGFLDNRTNTYTIAALDGGDRMRTFRNVILDRAATTRQRVVFA